MPGQRGERGMPGLPGPAVSGHVGQYFIYNIICEERIFLCVCLIYLKSFVDTNSILKTFDLECQILYLSTLQQFRKIYLFNPGTREVDK